MKLVFAPNNKNKVKEVQALMPSHITLLSLKDINCTEDIPETQNTIAGNARQKANYIKTNYGYDCFADDTGLEVKSLNGAPGVLSARYAGPEKNDTNNMDLLLANLKHSKQRDAQFKTVITLIFNDKTIDFTGICMGEITETKMGSKGFGYDPIFMPLKHDKTFAEMDLSTKNKIGHRGKATTQLINFLNSEIIKKD